MEAVLNDDLNDNKPDSKDGITETSQTVPSPDPSKEDDDKPSSVDSNDGEENADDSHNKSSIQIDEDFSIFIQSLVNTQNQLESCLKKYPTPNLYWKI